MSIRGRVLRSNVDMTQGRPLNVIFSFALPLLMGNLFNQLYNVVDTAIVGRALGADALAAVGSSYTLMTFLTSILLGLCMGSGALWSMLYGAEREEELKRCIFASFVFIGAVAVLLNVGVLALLEPVMTLLRIPAGAWDETRAYLRVVLLGVCFTFLYNYFACLLRSVGNSVAPLAFLAHTTVYAYEAFRVDAMQYLHIPFRPEQLTALLDRATEPEYGPVIPVTTAMGLRALPFADIEYLECTHHVVHYHLASGEDVASLSLRVPFSEVAKPLLADARFLQPHRSYVVNLAAAAQLSSGELWMRSGARVPIPRGREPAVRAAFRAFLEG